MSKEPPSDRQRATALMERAAQRVLERVIKHGLVTRADVKALRAADMEYRKAHARRPEVSESMESA